MSVRNGLGSVVDCLDCRGHGRGGAALQELHVPGGCHELRGVFERQFYFEAQHRNSDHVRSAFIFSDYVEDVGRRVQGSRTRSAEQSEGILDAEHTPLLTM